MNLSKDIRLTPDWNPPCILKEKDKEDIVFTTPARKPQGKSGIIAVVILFIVLAAAAVFYFMFKNNKDQKSDQLLVKNDSTVLQQPVKQTPPIADTAAKQSMVSNDTSTFKIVVREYTSMATSNDIFKRYSSWGHQLVQINTDSNHLKLAMPFRRPLADTTAIKDSLKRIFAGSNPYVILNQ